MTQEEMELVVKDLCGRLPYGVMCKRGERARKVVYIKPYQLYAIGLDNGEYISQEYTVEEVKPYLRPLSSMTEEEYNDMYNELYLSQKDFYTNCSNTDYIGKYIRLIANDTVNDWLNKNMFDYRGIIPKGLALEAPAGLYD